MKFPILRLQRLRQNPILRKMFQEIRLSVSDLIMPYFVVPGRGVKKEINSMPGQYHFSIDVFLEELEEVKNLKIPAIILFGIPKIKDNMGSEAYDEEGIIQSAVRAIKEKIPEIVIITDVCLCGYTDHGHCGLISNNKIDNDLSLELINKIALSQARAGADIVAPSDMMDGRVKSIREILDKNGYYQIPIMSYAVKYASSFYGPFREAASCAPLFGDRKNYQMDYRRDKEAILEAGLDIQEGADILMVKPALAYLDIISKIKEKFNHPLAAYSVSGEYNMVKAASKAGWIKEEEMIAEILTGIKRAGADIIITYFAKDVAKLIHGGVI
ncbi:MAG: porphobilinogen synthase [bacterium]